MKKRKVAKTLTRTIPGLFNLDGTPQVHVGRVIGGHNDLYA